ncbi:dUTPase [Pseudidiomarina terrestris]|uniref:dUTP diphosphatase n=1 Tax=Pseudidiomarina terrestris TaxID=2820060 RepID=A0AAW7R399_9GAMM|nr:MULTISPECIES: dUTPase [unclassified Pseudidiomarina]MDN7125447.1 dUTP diphosphatase [Pseudidiomarina sp. 1APP75-32.1]MDN7128055.1 dUTP diphosphatase [Pseudidiomarina sp. 1APR75-33.1]MDN7130205.1 dUTP diphosphatase [Pseudidiomarina sp. 1APR75-15]MDN7135714.1 dUTP diphosphatase [Pseudidiomarina sp. 1ASP75-5]MDN7137249.1 dUTP diphosphatase [Pseudidiomarina sp. 1ASP75-14]
MTPAQARQLVAMQIAFNQVIDPDYPAAPKVKRDDVKAILVELGEYFEHTAYKWWKKQSADWAQANMELIDILHFAISDAVEHACRQGKNTEAALEYVAQLMLKSFANDAAVQDGKELVAALAADGSKDYPLVCGEQFFDKLLTMLVDAYGDADTVYLTYIGKNALNNLRQQRGYKQGTYIKMWQGEEDNEVMMRLLGEHQQSIVAAEQPLLQAQTLLLDHYDKQVAQA